MTTFPCPVRIDGESYDCTFNMSNGLAELVQCETMSRATTENMLGMVAICEMESQACDAWDEWGEREYMHQIRQDAWEFQEAADDDKYHARAEERRG